MKTINSKIEVTIRKMIKEIITAEDYLGDDIDDGLRTLYSQVGEIRVEAEKVKNEIKNPSNCVFSEPLKDALMKGQEKMYNAIKEFEKILANHFNNATHYKTGNKKPLK